jgi:hypothetical protein
MSHNEKYQAGEAYGDVKKAPTANFFADPVKVATDLLKDYAGLRSEASIPEIAGLIKGLMQKGEPLDDRKGYGDSFPWDLKVILTWPQHNRAPYWHSHFLAVYLGNQNSAH